MSAVPPLAAANKLNWRSYSSIRRDPAGPQLTLIREDGDLGEDARSARKEADKEQCSSFHMVTSRAGRQCFFVDRERRCESIKRRTVCHSNIRQRLWRGRDEMWRDKKRQRDHIKIRDCREAAARENLSS